MDICGMLDPVPHDTVCGSVSLDICTVMHGIFFYKAQLVTR